MALQTELALQALQAALTGKADLPGGCRRNDLTLQDFEDSGTAGIRFKLMMADEAITSQNEAIGEPLVFELGVGAEILFAVEGLPGAERDAIYSAGVEALSLALWPEGEDGVRRPLAVPGAFEDLQPTGNVDREHIIGEAGMLPVEMVTIKVNLFITAPTPLG